MPRPTHSYPADLFWHCFGTHRPPSVPTVTTPAATSARDPSPARVATGSTPPADTGTIQETTRDGHHGHTSSAPAPAPRLVHQHRRRAPPRRHRHRIRPPRP